MIRLSQGVEPSVPAPIVWIADSSQTTVVAQLTHCPALRRVRLGPVKALEHDLALVQRHARPTIADLDSVTEAAGAKGGPTTDESGHRGGGSRPRTGNHASGRFCAPRPEPKMTTRMQPEQAKASGAEHGGGRPGGDLAG
jgi:hypothetical protein